MLKDIHPELENLSQKGQVKRFDISSLSTPGFVNLRGKSLVDFTNWDFANLNFSPLFRRAAHSEVEQGGFGVRASRIISGTTHSHIACEERIASFLHTKSALLFSSRSQVVISLIAAIACEQDTIFVDEMMQGPVVDAAFLVGAKTAFFNGADVDSLGVALEKYRGSAGNYVFVESFSLVRGANIELVPLIKIASSMGAEVFVDESYSLGLHGARGAGSIEKMSGELLPYAKYGDLSLALCGWGGFLAGPAPLTTWLLQRSRTVGQESALPSPICAAVHKALDLLELDSAAREKAAFMADKLRAGLKAMGIRSVPMVKSPIVVLPTDKFSKASKICQLLESKGFLAASLPILRVRDESGVVQFIINCEHKAEQIEDLLSALSEILPKLS
ncbi:MAG: aminotransferase class I/II-fold pyridoxal phosphate-dependent enzyme [Bdellovibrionales bacterium]|nr:aminotransferase class I/II-fold pyridoxal phosphate-dependent enzyme [Bdellovibrionales bacterium]